MADPLTWGPNGEILAEGRAQIAEHRAVFAAYETAALRCTDDLEAVALAQAAYRWAYRKHPGTLASPALEALLNGVGRRHVPATGPAAASGPVQRVLHVATEIYATGGHTRVLERWITQDHDRRSTLMLLGHDDALPEVTARILDEAGVPVVRPVAHADVFTRARHLRALAAGHDIVVLHVHPFDVVTALAFADPAGRPPVLLFNHASHQAWIGVGAADAVASLWEIDRRQAVTRRGFDEARSVLLPLPAPPAPALDRARARAELGIPTDTPVVLAVGAAYKVAPVLAPTFHDLCALVLHEVPEAILLVAGPDATQNLIPDHPRAFALGLVPELGPLLAAADLLLDTWPISGATAMLDAAGAGLPILSLGDPAPGAESMIRPPQGMFGAVVVEPDPEALVARVAALLADAPARAAIGATARERVRAVHTAQGWQAAMEDAVAVAVAHRGHAAVPPPGVDDQPTVGELVMQLAQRGGARGYSAYHAYLEVIPDLPPARRPADDDALRAAVDALLAAPVEAPGGARGVAAPPVEPAAIARLLAEIRRRVATGELRACVIVVAPDDVAAAAELLRAGLADGPDVELDLLGADDLATVLEAGDVLVEA